MTKEETAYAAALNLIGSGTVLGSPEDAPLRRTLEDLRYEALASVMPAGPKVRCPHCPTPFPCDGPDDGKHFADLWEHLIVSHRIDTWIAAAPAQTAWIRAVENFEGAQAA
jgi:hypothetical protein